MISFKSFWLLQEDNKEHMIGKIMQHYNVDEQQAKNVLQQWLRIKEKAKTEYPNKGILSWNSIESLQQDMDDLMESPEFKKHEREFNRVAMAHGAEKVFENSECIIYLVHNKWASILLGKGTQWCISAMEDNAWHNYIDPVEDRDDDIKKSIFFFLIDKKNKTTITTNKQQFTVPIKWAIQCMYDDDIAIWDNTDAEHGDDELQELINQYHLPDNFEADYLYFRKLKQMSDQEQVQLSPKNAYNVAKRAGHAIAALEPVIATNLEIAVTYAIHVRKKRFKQIEQKLILSKNEAYRSYYMKAFFKDAPWPEFFALKSQQYFEQLQKTNVYSKHYILGVLLDYSVQHNDAQQEFYLQQLEQQPKLLVIDNRKKWGAYNKKFFPQHWMQAQKIIDDFDYNAVIAANHAIAINKRNEKMEQTIAKQGGINYIDALAEYALHFNLAFKPNMQYRKISYEDREGQLTLYHFVNK
jgi:hypothetical protein